MFQFGFEAADGSRLAILYNHTSERTRAVANLSDNLPEIVEEVPNSLDVVYSRIVEIAGNEWAIGLEARNLLDDDYEAYQTSGDTVLPVDTYAVGRQFGISFSRSW